MNKTVERALQLDKYNQAIPELEIGDEVELQDVWDGEGDAPECSYAYKLTNNGEDGESNYEIHVNYEFEMTEKNENSLKSVVKITSIELV